MRAQPRLIVSVAGRVDLVWHTVPGVEADLDALVFAGPLRAALQAGAAGLPAAFSAAFAVTGLAFFTRCADPFTHLYPVEGYRADDGGAFGAALSPEVVELQAVAGVAGVVVAAALVAVRRQPPAGSSVPVRGCGRG